MKTLFVPTIALLALQSVLPNNLQAEAVTNWHTFRATTATTLAGQGTANPVFGSIAEPAGNGFLVGYLNSSYSLANVGDSISLTFNVSFNDAVGMGNGGDNFRFSLFDLNGQARVIAENSATAGVDGQTDDWRGYIYGVRNGTGTGSGGSIRERIAALATGDNIFATANANSASAPSLGAVGGTSVTMMGYTNSVGPAPTFLAEMKLTKTLIGVDLTGFFSNASGTNIFSVSDNTSPSPLNFEAVAFLNGAGISADQIIFENVDVTFAPVPEPTTWAMMLMGFGGVAMMMRRKSK